MLPSLRQRMLWRVLMPLALTWLAGTAAVVGLASSFTRDAFDRSLLDDAYAVAANVGAADGEPVLNLSPREVGEVLFNQAEQVFFAVLRSDGRLVAGHAGLGAAESAAHEAIAFDDRRFRGTDLRVVTLRREQPAHFVVVVGETVRERRRLVQRLFVQSVAPQLALLLLLGWWLRRSIGRQLGPLAALQEALGRRDMRDLAPLAVDPATRDIARLAEAFNALMQRIAAGVQAQREFAGNIAHELRTPLAGIRSLAEYGLAQPDPAVWRRQLRSVIDSEERASHLVDQLLALALADEARENLHLVPVAVDELVRELVLRQVMRADAAGVDLGAVGLDKPVRALADVALLEGLLGNLLDNALRYGRPAAGPARVTVGIVQQGDEVGLTVSDNGPGVDETQRQRLLGRWQQGGTQPGPGAGLGLAIVERYVELLGGRFELGPVPDGPGLRASVWIAAAREG